MPVSTDKMRSNKTMRVDFDRFCGMLEHEPTTENAIKAFNHKPYTVKEDKKQ